MYSRQTPPSSSVLRRSYRFDEFCRRHGVSREWVYSEIRAGRLKAKKAGKITFITDEAEAEWLANMPALVLSPST